MKTLFYLGHPAHYHLFKNSIRFLRDNGHEVFVLIKRKDVLEDLLDAEGIPYLNIFPKTRGVSKFSMAQTVLKRNFRLFNFCRQHKPDILIGTSIENSHIGKLLKIPAINVNEDDHDVVPLYAQLSYPLANVILCPTTCSTGRWEYKTLKYKGYHELAYLHPNHFKPNLENVIKTLGISGRYFILRFAKLNAHHDNGIRGISNALAMKLIEILKPHGRVFITSEKRLEPEFEPYRIKINPIDMHDVLAFADLYIGDSQTMAAEAGVLGTPFIRYNDFVNRIGYLDELEKTYHLGYGITPDFPHLLLETTRKLLSIDNIKEKYQLRRKRMLLEKIDVNQFLIWFITNFPKSKAALMTNNAILNQFQLSEPELEKLFNEDFETIGEVFPKIII